MIKSRLRSIKQKIIFKPELNNTKSNLPPSLQSFKQRLLSGNGFVEFKYFLNI